MFSRSLLQRKCDGRDVWMLVCLSWHGGPDTEMVQMLGSSVTRSQTEESAWQERRCFCGHSKAAPPTLSSPVPPVGSTGQQWRPARIGSHPRSCSIYSKWAMGLGPWWLKYIGLGISGDGVGMNPLMLLLVTHLDVFFLLFLHWALQILLFLRRTRKHRTASG